MIEIVKYNKSNYNYKIFNKKTLSEEDFSKDVFYKDNEKWDIEFLISKKTN